MIDKCVANASPLILLGKINRLDLLTDLYAEVIIPQGVATEIRAGSEDDPARSWLDLSASTWIREVDTIEPVIAGWDLGIGEHEVLTWAYRHPGYEALLDDRAGRNCALTLGIPIRGTLGVILAAKKRGLIEQVNPIFQELIHAGFRIAPQLLRTALELAGE